MTANHHDEVVAIPPEEHEALKAEVGRQQAMRAIMDHTANPGQVRTFTRDELAAEWGIGG